MSKDKEALLTERQALRCLDAGIDWMKRAEKAEAEVERLMGERDEARALLRRWMKQPKRHHGLRSDTDAHLEGSDDE